MFLLDTANLDEIREGLSFLPIDGVTTNPSILKKEGAVAFFSHLRAIRGLIGPERSLHVQVVSQEAEEMLKEARAILKEVDPQVYIKVPVTIEGLKVIKSLKAQGTHVTATAIYSELQAELALAAGADYLAPYVNRMENLGIPSQQVIESIHLVIDQQGSGARIVGASYKNSQQVTASLVSGAHDVTVSYQILRDALTTAPIQQAVQAFEKDWQETFGSDVFDQ